jgi:hypothetical protein
VRSLKKKKGVAEIAGRIISIACYAANEKKPMHKEYKRTTIKWKLETRVIKIVERKEVLEVSLKEMMLQQI